MKINYLYCLLFCSLFFLSNSCKKEDPLPATTGEGKNIFACYVNGEVWKPYSEDFKANTRSAEYYSGTLSIGALRSTKDFSEKIFIVLKDIPLTTGSYPLNDSTKYGRYIKTLAGTVGGDTYTTIPTHVGNVTITKVDQSRRIVTGTFFFKARQTNGSATVTVADGRFDLIYH